MPYVIILQGQHHPEFFTSRFLWRGCTHKCVVFKTVYTVLSNSLLELQVFKRELALEEDHAYSTFEVGQGSGSAPEPERPKRVSASRQPTLTTWTDLEDATPATAKTEGFLTELGAQVEMQGGLILLALESWASQTDAQRVALWHAISDAQGENRELRLQLADERCAWLELAEIVNSIRRGQEPRGDV
ncbi:hypothetical protein Tco_0247533 [Tanacetum coccineum]